MIESFLLIVEVFSLFGERQSSSKVSLFAVIGWIRISCCSPVSRRYVNAKQGFWHQSSDGECAGIVRLWQGKKRVC